MGEKTVQQVYTIAEAASHSGLSLWMVDYLCRTQVLVPSGTPNRARGRARLYSFGDIVMLRAIATLLDKGVEVARLKEGLAGLRKFHPEITKTSLPKQMLFTDGKRVYFKDRRHITEDLGRGQYVFAFVLELKGIHKEVLVSERDANLRKRDANLRKARRSGT